MSIDCRKKAAKQIIVKKDQHGDTLVHFAARYHAIDVLKLFVNEFSADVTGVNIHGRQPLHEAIDDLECVKFLCHHSNIDANCIKHDGWTPIMISAIKGRIDIAKELVQTGARVNLKNKDSWNSLHLASKEGHLALVKYLTLLSPETVFTPSNSGRLPIHTAALYIHVDIVLFFLEYFSNSNLPFYNTAHLDIFLTTSDISGINFFQKAVISGNLRLIKTLLEDYKIDLNAMNKLGRQAIHHSAMTGNAEDLWTPLHFAANERHEKIFTLLVNQYKARKDIRDRHGRTALDIGIV
ncbi:hypothetical protein G9A89_015976 [Geosiphon pyriformis]|nr:hypothetical protein G9A89_015976 [Geosiphon pyriformis]